MSFFPFFWRVRDPLLYIEWAQWSVRARGFGRNNRLRRENRVLDESSNCYLISDRHVPGKEGSRLVLVLHSQISELKIWLTKQFESADKKSPISTTLIKESLIYNFTTDSQTKYHAATIVANNFRGKGYEYRAQVRINGHPATLHYIPKTSENIIVSCQKYSSFKTNKHVKIHHLCTRPKLYI
ncbi:hypothetical protein YC2023_116456 [Brassica napus]